MEATANPSMTATASFLGDTMPNVRAVSAPCPPREPEPFVSQIGSPEEESRTNCELDRSLPALLSPADDDSSRSLHPQAGTVSVLDPVGAKAAFGGVETEPRPTTPDEIKKFRRSTLHEPGRRVVHPGMAGDTIPTMTFGVKSVLGEPAADVMATYPRSELDQWRLERTEDVYASTRREPLGKSFVRGHHIPDKFNRTGFGQPGSVAPTSSIVKDLVFPHEGLHGDEEGGEAHRMYVKSHGNYAPGEQRNRGYAESFDRTATFGGKENDVVLEGVAKALNPLKDETQKTFSATIVNKAAEDFKATAGDELGRVRRLGAGERNVPDGFTYGAPSRRRDAPPEPDAGTLIKGDYTEEEQAPDPTIGKSMRFQGYKFDPTPVASPDRVFGVPCIRADLGPKDPQTKGLADMVNYGNDPGAGVLVNPGYGADRGVVETDLQGLLTKEELREFYEETGIALRDGEFETAFNAAVAIDGDGGDGVLHPARCSIATFQKYRMRVMRGIALGGR